MSESVIKEITEEIVKKVEKKEQHEAVKVDYSPAANGDRERPWHLSNKAPTMGELKDGKQLPIVSIFQPDLNKIEEEDWVQIHANKKTYMTCVKSFLLMTNCVCEMKYDVTNTVVTHLLLHSPEQENNDRNKEFWKNQFRKYLRVGAMSYKEAREEVKMYGKEKMEMKTIEEEMERLGVEETKSNE
jgi:hypothetical protein